jgi:hypothetical protein
MPEITFTDRIPEATRVKETDTREHLNQLTRVLRNNFSTLERAIANLQFTAEAVSYDNSTSGSSAENVQDALDDLFTAVSSGVADGDKGDITVSSTGTVWTIDDNVVSNAKAADMPANTIKGNNTGGSADPDDLTISEVKTMLSLSGTNSGDQQGFKTIVVAGQDSVVADQKEDTLTFVAGDSIILTTDASTYTITITSTASSDFYLDGGNSASVYGPMQFYDGGDSLDGGDTFIDEGGA